MPLRAPSACSVPGCRWLAPAGGKCEPHRKAWQREFEARRGGSSERGYGAVWQRLRNMVLQAEPLCRECRRVGKLTEATEVDHVVPKARGGKDEMENLQALCKSCHSRKTMQEAGRQGGRE